MRFGAKKQQHPTPVLTKSGLTVSAPRPCLQQQQLSTYQSFMSPRSSPLRPGVPAIVITSAEDNDTSEFELEYYFAEKPAISHKTTPHTPLPYSGPFDGMDTSYRRLQRTIRKETPSLFFPVLTEREYEELVLA